MPDDMMSKPPAKPLLRVSGGTPAGYPDFTPLNPWGRAMPKPTRPPRPVLYQVVVHDGKNGNRELRVGPRMQQEFAEMLRLGIAEQISLGAEKRWRDPVLVADTAEIGRAALITRG